MHVLRWQQVLAASAQSVVPGMQHCVPHTAPEAQVQTLLEQTKLFEQLPQLASSPFPGFTIVPQFPPGEPASRQTGGPSHVPLSWMHACPFGHAAVQSTVPPQPLSRPLRQMLGKLLHVSGVQTRSAPPSERLGPASPRVASPASPPLPICVMALSSSPQPTAIAQR